MGFSEGNTTIVLGAGASSEVGLPVGQDLKNRIASLLNITYECGRRRVTGSGEINAAFKLITQRDGTQDINPYLYACWKIRDGMPQAISIDNYLDAHNEDPLMVVSGKLGIAQSILEAEHCSSIYLNPGDRQKTLDFAQLENTWYNKFVQLLTESLRAGDLAESMQNLTVISFNYDRCFEHFLFLAIQNYYQISKQKAAEALQGLQIYHPYGRVGSLPWQNEQLPVEYGSQIHPVTLMQIADQIRTFTEGTDPKSSEIMAIRSSVADCDRLIFLGFAFHPMNMQLLASQSENAPTASYGTALGLSRPDCDILHREISQLVGPEIERVELRNDLTCSQLLDEYRRSLTTL